MNRRVLVLFVVLGLIVLTAGALAYFLLNSVTGRSVIFPGSGSPTPIQPAHAGKGCGVRKNSDGTYSFSWLHVSSDGKIVDEKGCIVPLVGFNMGGLFLGDAGGSTDAKKIAWYAQTFQMNLVRTNFNTRWWVDDVFVPDANMHFRQWLQQWVKWQEQNGNYVELDAGPNFPEPPCGGTVTLCPSQDQGKKDYTANPNPTTAQELTENISYHVKAWTDIAKIYADDPAVLYDAWNEPKIKNLPTFFQDMNTLINTIRAQNPKSLIFVYEHGWADIVSGHYPDYTQPNLVIDHHIYPGFNGVSPATKKQCSSPGNPDWSPSNSGLDKSVAFAQSHGQATIIGEWGGCYDSPKYNEQMISFAKAQDIALAYFQAGDVSSTAKRASGYQINDNGRLVQTGYASIMQSAAG